MLRVLFFFSSFLFYISYGFVDFVGDSRAIARVDAPSFLSEESIGPKEATVNGRPLWEKIKTRLRNLRVLIL